MNTNYTSRPWHLVFPLCLFALGSLSFTWNGWMLFGVVCYLVAFVSSGWIVIAGMWCAWSQYYDSVAGVLTASQKSDLDKMAALGLKFNDDFPDRLRVDLYSGHQSRHFALPISPVKLRSLSIALLNGQPFSEKRWVGDGKLLSSSEFRKLSLVMRDERLIVPVSDKDNRQGFMLTDAGRQTLQSFCSPTPPLSDG